MYVYLENLKISLFTGLVEDARRKNNSIAHYKVVRYGSPFNKKGSTINVIYGSCPLLDKRLRENLLANTIEPHHTLVP